MYMLGTENVQHSAIERQCFSVAYKLIGKVIELKGCWPPLNDLASDPRVRGLLSDLDRWVDHLVAMEGSL
jgi:hypothetical protein